jgi:hypothetical protein
MSSTFSNTNLTGSHIGEQDLANGGSARTTVGTDSVSNRPSGGDPSQDEELPPQLHAGKVGYGPNYHAGPVGVSLISARPIPVFWLTLVNGDIMLKDAGDKLTGVCYHLISATCAVIATYSRWIVQGGAVG